MTQKHSFQSLIQARSRRGAALVEYGMLVGLIAVLAIGSVLATGRTAKEALCISTQALASARGSEEISCDSTGSGPGNDLADIVLPEGAELNTDPVTVLADFDDVLFARDETGGRALLASMPAPASADFTLEVSITGREPQISERSIAACYREAGATICSTPGNTAQIDVPAGVSEIGFSVDLPSEVSSYWKNDVQISVTEAAGYVPGSWAIDVSRQHPLPVFGASFDIKDMIYSEAASQTLYAMAPIEGTWNVNGVLILENSSPSLGAFVACYRMEIGGSLTCGQDGYLTGAIELDVPMGAAEIGFWVVSGGQVIGSDKVFNVDVSFNSEDGQEGPTDNVTITRKNLDEVFNVSFDIDDITYSEAANISLYAMAPIEGDWNVDGVLTLENSSPALSYFTACYRMETGGSLKCGQAGYNTGAIELDVPMGAAEIGFRIASGAQVVASDRIYNVDVSFNSEKGTAGPTDNVTITRENLDEVFDVSFDIEDVTFSGANNQFIYAMAPIEGDWNVDGVLTLENSSQPMSLYIACYRMEAGGSVTCRQDGYSTGTIKLDVPTGAAEIGFRVASKAQTVAADKVYKVDVSFDSVKGTSGGSDNVTIVRENLDEVFDVTFDIEDVTFSGTNNQYIYAMGAIEGDWNVDGVLSLENSTPAMSNFRACYRMEVGGAVTCENTGYASGTIEIDVPMGAAEIGVRVASGAQVVGDDKIFNVDVSFDSSKGTAGPTHNVTITRENL